MAYEDRSKTPTCYLSGNDVTGWQVIQNGLPVTSSRASKSEALLAAKKAFNLNPVFYYNGDEFVKLEY